MSRALLVVVLLAACGDGAPGQPDAGCPTEPLPQPPGLDPAIEAEVDALLADMTLEEKIAEMHGATLTGNAANLWPAGGNQRLGIPPFLMSDGPRGLTARSATCFPVAHARGAAFDRELERAIGEAV